MVADLLIGIINVDLNKVECVEFDFVASVYTRSTLLLSTKSRPSPPLLTKSNELNMFNFVDKVEHVEFDFVASVY